MAALPVARCESDECAKEFQPRREWQKFCSTKCRMDHANGRRKAGLKLLARAEVAPLALEAAMAPLARVEPQLAPLLGVATHQTMSASGLST